VQDTLSERGAGKPGNARETALMFGTYSLGAIRWSARKEGISMSLVAHLVARFASNQQENLATESLLYILHNSEAARRAFMEFVSDTGAADLPLTFRSQANAADGSIPDLVGTDLSGVRRLIVEVKFWAGLTSNQPGAYLAQLPEGEPGSVLFVCPEMRMPTLWRELLTRSQATKHKATGAMRVASVVRPHTLALTSWRHLLDFLLINTARQADSATSEDIRQLIALCDRMDSNAFLPFNSIDLTNLNIPRVTGQLTTLVEHLVNALLERQIAEPTRRSFTGGKSWYGRAVDFAGVHAAYGYIQYSDLRWAKYGHPVSLGIYGRNWQQPSPAVRAVLQDLEQADPPRCFIEPQVLIVPLHIPPEEERDAVTDSLVNQVEHVVQRLRRVPAEPGLPGNEESPGPEPDSA
jgi:hypothetical protein